MQEMFQRLIQQLIQPITGLKVYLNGGFVAMILVLSGAVTASEPLGPWEKALEEDGVTVYLRPVPGANAKSLKGTVLVQADKETVFAHMRDVPNYTQWVHQCAGGEWVDWPDAPSDLVTVARLKTALPWPLDVRDVVFERTERRTESDGFRMDFTARSDLLAEDDCCVRVNDAFGSFLVEDGDEPGVSRVTYELFVDPGGSIPAWLANLFATQAPFETLVNLRELVENPAS